MAKSRIIYLTALVGCVLFFIFYKGYLSHLTLIMVVVLPLVSLLVAVLSCFLVQVQLLVGKSTVGKEEEIPLVVKVENRGFLPCPEVEVRMQCENLLGESDGKPAFSPMRFSINTAVSPRTAVQVSQSLSCTWCGAIKLSVLGIRVIDVLGLFRLPAGGKISEFSINVLPDIQPAFLYLDPEPAMPGGSEKYSPWKPGDDPSEVFQIREFREGDSLRRVHRKLTQRMGQLMVRDFSLPVDHALYFLTEPAVGAEPKQLDRMMTNFLSVSAALLEEGNPVWCGWMEDGVCRWEELKDEGELSAVLGRMLALKVNPGRPAINGLTEQGKLPIGAHLLYFTTPGEEEAAEKGVEMLQGESGCRKVTVLVAGNIDGFSMSENNFTVVSSDSGELDLEELVL